ncbi:threonine dehydratase [Granulicella sp. L60]|uniref:threonine dehydratase n=1 Tax=Granulicella sp. L60 TaxID=1641866 RepID=UPI00131E6E76|nr:threonine dehydratase [Granulicella sp. L60]
MQLDDVVVLPGLEEIRAAAELIYKTMPATPQYSWPLINARAGAEVWVKHENHTPVGAFKVRGGLVYMDCLRRERPEVTTVVSATRGNHGQSMAFAGAQHGFRVVIVVPFGNSPEKNRAMRALGAELVEFGQDFQEACEHAAYLERENGWHRVPSFDLRLVTGVSTYALEMFSGCPELETVYVPIGMGSGVCGTIAARNALGLKTKVVGVVSSHAPAYALSFDAGRVIEHETRTEIADGVACRKPDVSTLEIIMAGMDRILMVDDDEVKDAMRAYFVDTHNVAEGAGAIGLAALLKDREAGGKRVGTVLCGGNVDSDAFAEILCGGVRTL